MTDVVRLEHGQRAGGTAWRARVAEVRTRLRRELEDLSGQALLPADRRGARPGTADEVLHRRIRLLGQLIAGLEAAAPGTLWDDRAGYGSTVFLRDLRSGEERFCTLMAGQPVEGGAGQVSLDSALGRALLGCRAGDEPVVREGDGERRLRVFAVHTLPRSLGMAGTGPRGAA